MNCKNIEDFRAKLYDVTNNCNLPVAVAFYVVKDFYRDFNQTYLNILQQEAADSFEESSDITFDYNIDKQVVKNENEE